MKYIYADISDLRVHVALSLHDIDRLRRCIAEFEPEENAWFFKRFKETLRECQEQTVSAMESECSAMRTEFKAEDQVNRDEIL